MPNLMVVLGTKSNQNQEEGSAKVHGNACCPLGADHTLGGRNMTSNLKMTNVSLSRTITALELCSRVGELNSILNPL